MIVRLTDDPLAMLETLIHFELAPGEAPVNFRLLEVECPDDLRVMSLSASPPLALLGRATPSLPRREAAALSS